LKGKSKSNREGTGRGLNAARLRNGFSSSSGRLKKNARGGPRRRKKSTLKQRGKSEFQKYELQGCAGKKILKKRKEKEKDEFAETREGPG